MALTAVLPAGAGAAGRAAPVIHEKFTTQPCSGKPAHRSTLQLEGCAEQRVLGLDQEIDVLNADIFAKLATVRGKRDFLAANTGWVRYRNSACASESDNYAGGSIAPVIYANCLATLDGDHVHELKGVLRSLSSGG